MKNRIKMVGPDVHRYLMTRPWIGMMASELHNKIENAVHVLTEENDPISTHCDGIDSILDNTEFLSEIVYVLEHGIA